MDNLSASIRNLFLNTNTNAHGIAYGRKIVSGQLTDDLAITYFVEKKLPIDQLNDNNVIPTTLSIDGITYYTDVVEQGRIEPLLCNALNSASCVTLQSHNRPLSGGMEISNTASYGPNVSSAGFVFFYGTLGMIAVDNTDGNLVGVTNAHVAVKDAILTSDRNPNGVLESIIDNNDFYYNTGALPYEYLGTYPPGILQNGSYNMTHGSNNLDFIFNNRIGVTKRYQPLTTGSNYVNTIDCAIIQLDSGAGIIDSTSAQQAFINGTYAMPFANSGEISSVTGNIPLYSVGRTSGPKWTGCPMSGSYIHITASAGYPFQDGVAKIYLSDIVQFSFIDQSSGVTIGGDSGSVIMGNFNGVNKVVGLVWGGGTGSFNGQTTYHGVFSRIDNIANEMNISAWDGGTLKFGTTDPAEINKVYTSPYYTGTTITISGIKYYQAGLQSVSNPTLVA